MSVGQLRSKIEKLKSKNNKATPQSPRSKHVGTNQLGGNNKDQLRPVQPTVAEAFQWAYCDYQPLKIGEVLGSHNKATGSGGARVRSAVTASSKTNMDSVTNTDTTVNAADNGAELSQTLFNVNTSEAEITHQIKQIAQKEINTEAEEGDKPDPETMDVCTVVKLLQQLQLDMKTEIASQISTGTSSEDQTRLASRVGVMEVKERIMIETMSNMQDRINELQDKLHIIDSAAAKKMAILSGFYVNKNRGIARRQILTFFKSVMGIDVQMDDHYYIGNSQPREVIIIMATITDKKKIFHNISTIKDLVNEDGKKYVFRDFYTTKFQQLKKRGQTVADFVGTMQPAEQDEVTPLVGNNILVGNKQYKTRVQPPDLTKVLQMPLHQLNKIMSIQVDRADTIEKDGNLFTAYSYEATEYQAIQDAYMKIRLNHPSARHIVCAWSIPGRKIYEANDYCDDEEHGIGKHILDLLIDNNITCRAVFVVQKFGRKLNNERIAAYVEAAQSVVKQYPFNSILEKNQHVDPQLAGKHPASNQRSNNPPTYANITKGTAKSPPDGPPPSQGIRGRGGRRGGLRGRGRGRAKQFQPGSEPKRPRQHQTKEVKTNIPITEEELEKQTEFKFSDPKEAVGDAPWEEEDGAPPMET